MLLHKTVIIRKEEAKDSGKAIDPTKKSQVGVVEEVGAELDKDECGVTVGDRVVYYENSLLEIEYDGKKEHVLEYEDIVKVL